MKAKELEGIEFENGVVVKENDMIEYYSQVRMDGCDWNKGRVMEIHPEAERIILDVSEPYNGKTLNIHYGKILEIRLLEVDDAKS